MTQENETYTGINSYRILMWLAMVSMFMIFAGYTSGYIVRMGDGNWTVFQMPTQFLYSTLVILVSSVFMQWAVIAANYRCSFSAFIGRNYLPDICKRRRSSRKI